MKVKLDSSNFGYFAFNPSSPLLDEKDKITVIALNVLLGFTLGIGHLICGIVYGMRKEEMNKQEKKINRLGTETLKLADQKLERAEQLEVYNRAKELAPSKDQIDSYFHSLTILWKKPYREDVICFAKSLKKKNEDLLPIIKAFADSVKTDFSNVPSEEEIKFYKDTIPSFFKSVDKEGVIYFLSVLKDKVQENPHFIDCLTTFAKIPLELFPGDSFDDKVDLFFKLLPNYLFEVDSLKDIFELCKKRQYNIESLLGLLFSKENSALMNKDLLKIAKDFSNPDESIEELTKFLGDAKNLLVNRKNKYASIKKPLLLASQFCDSPLPPADQRIEILKLCLNLSQEEQDMMPAFLKHNDKLSHLAFHKKNTLH